MVVLLDGWFGMQDGCHLVVMLFLKIMKCCRGVVAVVVGGGNGRVVLWLAGCDHHDRRWSTGSTRDASLCGGAMIFDNLSQEIVSP